MSDKTNKQVYNFSSPKSSNSSPTRTFAEVVSPVVTPTRSFPKTSKPSKRKRQEKFQGSSKGISKFRKISKPVTTIHRVQFNDCNGDTVVKETKVVVQKEEEIVERIVKVEESVTVDKIEATVRNDPNFRPIKLKAVDNKVYTELYQSFEERNSEESQASQKVIADLTQALNSIFKTCSVAIDQATNVRNNTKKSSAPSLGELHNLCQMHAFESKVQTKKSVFLSDAIFSSMSIVSSALKNKCSQPEPSTPISVSSSSATGRRVRFSDINHFEPQSSTNFLLPKSSKSKPVYSENLQTKPSTPVTSSDSLIEIEIELDSSFSTKPSIVDSVKQAQANLRMTESYNEFKRSVADSAVLDNFNVSQNNSVDSSEPEFTNSQLTKEAYEEVISQLNKAAMNDPKKNSKKDSSALFFNKKP